MQQSTRLFGADVTLVGSQHRAARASCVEEGRPFTVHYTNTASQLMRFAETEGACMCSAALSAEA